MRFGVVLYCNVVENLCFQYCIELFFGIHEGTDALDEVSDLDADIPQEGVDIPSSHYHDFIWIHFG